MKKKMLKMAPAVLAAALAVLPCGNASASQGEPDWPGCAREGGVEQVQACRERVIAWWEQRLDDAVKAGTMQCPDEACRERLQQSMDAWTGYRDFMVKSAAEAVGSFDSGISMDMAALEMRYRLTRDQALHIESLAGQGQAR